MTSLPDLPRPLYLDHNASTPVDPEVFAAMQPYLGGTVGNPSSKHWAGRKARQAIDAARMKIADCLGCEPAELFFTSGATEANNLAIHAIPAGKTLVVSAVEHPSLLEPAERAAKRGAFVRYVKPNAEGIVVALADCLCDETAMICCQLANGEVGAIHPIAELAQQAAGRRFHVDAAQALGRIPISFRELAVTSLAISGHKVGGPVGIGALAIRADAPLPPMLVGGHQQAGVRAGTEPAALIVGLAKAVALAESRRADFVRKTRAMRDAFESAVLAGVSGAVVNGPRDGEHRLPNTSNISFPTAPAAVMLMGLDFERVACSAGSACASGSMLPSHVLTAMGLVDWRLANAVRFSFGWTSTPEDAAEAAERVIRVYARSQRDSA
jgi:cysteine desulfurase